MSADIPDRDIELINTADNRRRSAIARWLQDSSIRASIRSFAEDAKRRRAQLLKSREAKP